ncbi:hypothetical protein DV495_001365 [Geotrichum candidum]|uniref:Sugar phosphate phosphatase n=1 Tax=Geotrichum candidum TaxID=1173061 RepID=A0A0J9XJI2_GEOCN|nr:hypothetical protein DV454_003450 [Geotrichum candidum]KAF5113652.1 hypothetical protein DV452_003609 [Geotrichum candidum]KAF5132364.1 hypothetical protein DV495_001365 [Geotrichum candidum]KAF7498268.1 hypothetical protein DV113_003723 [Geotrichum candidum]KAI8135631.1 hypothetical protein DUD61_000688 [Geotrichum candidum]
MTADNTLPGPYLNNDKTSFAWPSARERWPSIIESIIKDVQQTIEETVLAIEKEKEAGTGNEDPSVKILLLQEKVEEGKVIITQTTQLLEDLKNDKPLIPFEGTEADLLDYNKELARIGPLTWLTAPWLFSECFMYRKLASFFTAQKRWVTYDPYARQKDDAFKASKEGVYELAHRYKELAHQLKTHRITPESQRLLFKEFTDISLWGNATDLSLLTNVSLDDIKTLQGAETRKKNEANILANDLEKAYESLLAKREATTPVGKTVRVDFVLDNAGFEFFADTAFILYLLDSNLADTVIVHPKNYPWFVSDVLPIDVLTLFSHLSNKNFFTDAEHRDDLDAFADRLVKYHADGKLLIRTSPFWTTYHSFDEIRSDGAGKAVWEDLKDSDLVVFKGDLNHRKLIRDLEWPRTTPFKTAIGALATSGIKVLTLRTIKADVVVGLEEGVEAELEKKWVEMGNENKLGWAYSGKWAVIQFSDGSN